MKGTKQSTLDFIQESLGTATADLSNLKREIQSKEATVRSQRREREVLKKELEDRDAEIKDMQVFHW